jgi:poly-gamma-glutamate capsule biosynthesis protein CapA/YwtB (metallophosphatase superfamily)
MLAGRQPPSGSVLKLALAGDTMLGRGAADAIVERGVESLVAPELAAITRAADLFVLNLECCVSSRGGRWPDPHKPFFFRAPPAAVELLLLLGVDCVTLANNHALDFGIDALCDTFDHLDEAGIAWVGAGRDVGEARAPALLEANGRSVAIIGFSDHPAAYAARANGPGIAYADPWAEPVPEWIPAAIEAAAADDVVVTPHWGPNMNPEPLPRVRRGATALRELGATLVAGHSAHVFQGVERGIVYDLGDFFDDYAVDPVLRNDLGLLFLVTLGSDGPIRLEGVPLKLEYCHTRPAAGEDAAWIRDRFRNACAALGTDVSVEDNRLVVDCSRR